ncbi:MAG: hypothetical protein JSW28_02020 [Thermoplasmata archaeon]|nr:MAG: hypothetical protein JSW28_02020 [Thermoplasmata archaeon]
MKTYIRLMYNSKGTKPSEVYRILKEHKCVPAVGEYDFVYDWGEDKEAKMDELLSKLDSIHDALRPHDVTYLVCTSDPMYHIKEMDQPLSTGARARPSRAPVSDSDMPPPPDDMEDETKCPTCTKPATYVKRYDRWYCVSCKKYV